MKCAIFFFLFRFNKKETMLVHSTQMTDGIKAPSISFIARRKALGNSWKGEWNSTNDVNNNITSTECGEASDIKECIESKTFQRREIVKDALLGWTRRESLMDDNLWRSDFTNARAGMVHTLKVRSWRRKCSHLPQVPQRLGPLFNRDYVMFYLDQNLQYDIIVHDNDFFVLNANPLGLPSIYRGVDPKLMMKHYYEVTLTEHQKINFPHRPCEPKSDYVFQTCVRKQLASRLAFRLTMTISQSSPWTLLVIKVWLQIALGPGQQSGQLLSYSRVQVCHREFSNVDDEDNFICFSWNTFCPAGMNSSTKRSIRRS